MEGKDSELFNITLFCDRHPVGRGLRRMGSMGSGRGGTTGDGNIRTGANSPIGGGGGSFRGRRGGRGGFRGGHHRGPQRKYGIHFPAFSYFDYSFIGYETIDMGSDAESGETNIVERGSPIPVSPTGTQLIFQSKMLFLSQHD